MTMAHSDTTSRSRGAMRPRFASNLRPPESEGAGNAGCALRPRSRVQCAQESAHTSIQGSGGNPTFPAQWLYGLYRALPGDEFILSPSPADYRFIANRVTKTSADLTPATGARTTR